ncbi:unnamed protein product [Lactuca saligna]|uniref:Myb/SANT-like domain-containing protein n=1 Tax=Lactuca saligna TaxID=75948 RepID=A0AA36EG51_LACSI|nr:unnamed protein product [Lactuca saligna]
MAIDPFEDNASPDEGTGNNEGGNDDNVTTIGTSDEWTTFRDNLTQTILFVGMVEKSRNYRTWTTHEDAKLVEAMLNMVNAGGFKVDNGFKSGYLQHLGQALKDSLPNAGILAKPHIESRIRTMKKE